MKSFWKNFRKFRFKKEYLPLYLLFWLSFLTGAGTILSAILLLYQTEKRTHLLLLIGLLFLFLVLSFLCLRALRKRFLRIFWKMDRQFTRLERNNETLRKLDKKVRFEEVLDEYLEYFYTSVEGEYSAKLLQKQAELDYMQSQINPHFLYNTLDSIRGQAVLEGSRKTAEMIESLSILFRYTISKHGDILTLEQELSNVDNYLKLQQYRFRNRFELVKKIEEPELTLQYRIPKLTLQPIIENAIYHGLDDVSKNARIEIRIYTTQSRLIITIADNGKGMNSETLDLLNEVFMKNIYTTKVTDSSKSSSGMALANVNARIKLLFGERYGLTAYSTEGVGSKIQIVLPLLQEDEEALDPANRKKEESAL